MLTNAEIDSIINKERLTKSDVYLINHHLDSIKRMQDSHPNGLPLDVQNNTKRDLKKLMNRLVLEKENIRKSLEEKNLGEDVTPQKKSHLRLIE